MDGERMRAVVASMRAAPVPVPLDHPSRRHIIPFVTISREGGAGGRTVARHLVERLNEVDRAEEPWQAWDRELVEKVAAEHHLSADSVASLGDVHRTWMEDFISSLSQVPDADETVVFRRVAMTVRALAQRGRAVIVGRGGVFLTQKMPGGVHVRLIAPLQYRVENMARQLGLSQEAAREHVRVLDRNRMAFHRRYWPGEAGKLEVFTVVFNMAQVTEEQAAEAVVPLVLAKRPSKVAG